jgi:hypothetical protein
MLTRCVKRSNGAPETDAHQSSPDGSVSSHAHLSNASRAGSLAFVRAQARNTGPSPPVETNYEWHADRARCARVARARC